MKRRDLPEKACAYCEKAHILIDNESALCRHKGPVSLDFHCRRFVFDPLKVNHEPRKMKTNTKIETLWSDK